MTREFVLENQATPAVVYGEKYYTEYYKTTSGHSYDERGVWCHLMNAIGHVVNTVWQPRTALDVGCAYGYLVEALRSTGIDAEGVDVSEYAVSRATGAAEMHCRVQDLSKTPLEKRYDLITCIEVVEHMPDEAARALIRNMCAATGRVVFSSTSTDFSDVTHLNVQPNAYWRSRFLASGFLLESHFPAIAQDAFVFARPDWWIA